MPNVMAVGGVLAALFASTVATEPLVIPAERITISVETVNGSGCPAGTAEVSTAADNTAFTVSYSDYFVLAGAGAKPTEFRKNCQLSLKVQIPQGLTFAVAQVDLQGFAYLQRGATGAQYSHYYFMGTSPTAQTSHEFTGPYSGGWRTSDRAATLVYAPCGQVRNLNVNTELRLDAGDAESGTSFMAMDSSRGSVRSIYHLSWKEC
ncbi:DUF4360 domain-containing protein [Plantactinospora endophytica]|uniref:DUF4360 domain-containing protein n=1 Tax=Plantactinospora endophytica TaxID=673535 RepID=A0ABQ4E2I5_9ACTN|nr:DUF4360 domain-containing protein [Plantactinospora endophytica]GIG88923.1 hypothetical protein Pen02_38590 [Plantactinospora endophytica]